ncbi:hypothetical protein Ancab_024135 [Ancistrocladus abbreviatus]
MALEAVVYDGGPFGHDTASSKDPFNLMLESWGSDLSFPKDDEQGEPLQHQHGPDAFFENQAENFHSPFIVPILKNNDQWVSPTASTENHVANVANGAILMQSMTLFDANTSGGSGGGASSTRPKQRRARTEKKREEIENQRMTHIVVERNRRKQMNAYLGVLRSLMPESYVQRGDQASIIGAAINFVKALEHNLQCLSAQKHRIDQMDLSSLPFEEFFTFPQYSSSSTSMNEACQSGLAEVEVTMVESHANLKIRLLKRQPKQLLKVVAGLQKLKLSILHLNVSTVDQVALYTLNVKVEEGSELSSVGEIATAVHHMLSVIQEEVNRR